MMTAVDPGHDRTTGDAPLLHIIVPVNVHETDTKNEAAQATTCARKRPVPYYRPSPPSPSSDDSYRSYSRSRSRSRFRSRSLSLTKRYSRRRRSWSSCSLDSLKH